MWSLPDIIAMNERAAARAAALRLSASQGPAKLQRCQAYGCEEPAVKSDLYFDVFSDDPKGVAHTCEDHVAEHTGGLFECDACRRLMLDHITWERYAVELAGRTLCLKCAAEEYFSEARNWIDPRSVRLVVNQPHKPKLNGRNIPLFDQQTGVLNLGACRHVLGVKQPLPVGVKFVKNMEFDGADGFQLSGDDPMELVQSLVEPFCPVLDGAYQYALSIGIYVRDRKAVRKRQPRR